MKILQVCSGFISKWKDKFIIEGVKGLSLSHKGSKGYLKQEEKQEVLTWLKEKEMFHINELEY